MTWLDGVKSGIESLCEIASQIGIKLKSNNVCRAVTAFEYVIDEPLGESVKYAGMPHARLISVAMCSLAVFNPNSSGEKPTFSKLMSEFKNAVVRLRLAMPHCSNNFAIRSDGNADPFDFKTIDGIGSLA